MHEANAPDINTQHLRAVVAIADLGSFVAASARLQTAKGSLTRMIQRIEGELGFALFERTTRRVTLTPSGRDFIALARRTLTDLSVSTRSLRRMADQGQGEVTFSCIPWVVSSVASGLVARYLADRPDVTVHLRESSHETVLQEVRSGQADLGLTYVDQPADGVLAIPLGWESLHLLMPRNHALASRDTVNLRDLAGEPLIALPAGSYARRVIDSTAAAEGVVLRYAATVSRGSTIPPLVRAGVALAVLPAKAVPSLSGTRLVARPVAQLQDRLQLGIVTVRQRDLSPHAAGFLALLRDSWPRPN